MSPIVIPLVLLYCYAVLHKETPKRELVFDENVVDTTVSIYLNGKTDGSYTDMAGEGTRVQLI